MIEEKVIDPTSVSGGCRLTIVAESWENDGHLLWRSRDQFSKHCQHLIPRQKYHKDRLLGHNSYWRSQEDGEGKRKQSHCAKHLERAERKSQSKCANQWSKPAAIDPDSGFTRWRQSVLRQHAKSQQQHILGDANLEQRQRSVENFTSQAARGWTGSPFQTSWRPTIEPINLVSCKNWSRIKLFS